MKTILGIRTVTCVALAVAAPLSHRGLALLRVIPILAQLQPPPAGENISPSWQGYLSLSTRSNMVLGPQAWILSLVVPAHRK